MVKKLVASVIFCSLVYSTQAQQTYQNITEAVQATFRLRGKSGPRSVNWINRGAKYSFLNSGEIHTMDPKTGEDKLVFNNSGLTFPGSNKPFDYQAFQWSEDSRHLVFSTNFRHIFRNSGISDYYLYDLTTRQLTPAAK